MQCLPRNCASCTRNGKSCIKCAVGTRLKQGKCVANGVGGVFQRSTETTMCITANKTVTLQTSEIDNYDWWVELPLVVPARRLARGVR